MPAGRYWDLQLVQNYVYPWATFGAGADGDVAQGRRDEPIRIFRKTTSTSWSSAARANGYWRIMGAKYRKTVSVDAWR